MAKKLKKTIVWGSYNTWDQIQILADSVKKEGELRIEQSFNFGAWCFG